MQRLRNGCGTAAPLPPHTKWTRRVPHPVLIGHAASLTPDGAACLEGGVKDGEVAVHGRRVERQHEAREAIQRSERAPRAAHVPVCQREAHVRTGGRARRDREAEEQVSRLVEVRERRREVALREGRGVSD